MEYLGLTASFVEQQQYERAVPIAHIPYEVINQWGDNFPRGLEWELARASVYSTDETSALREFEAAWAVASRAVTDDYPTLTAVQALSEWQSLRQVAETALEVFEQRGTMREDEEVE